MMAEDSLLAEENLEIESWYSEEHKDLVEKQGWKQPSDVVRDYGELQKSASGKIRLPTPESSAEEISAFYDKIRGVENPDGYEIKDVPENIVRDEEMEALVRKVAFENGGQKVAVEAIIKSYYEALSRQVTEERMKSEKELKDEWKDDYETNLNISKRACRELGGEDFIRFLELTKMGNNSIIVKTFYNIGTKILSDTLIKGEQTGGEGKEEYKPAYPDSPEMYATDTSPEGEKARLWFTRHKGYVY